MPTADPSPADQSRLEDFNKYFDMVPATTRQQRNQVYQIRYRVYCEEFGYEPTAKFSRQQEIDEYDCQSIHCLVTHRQSGMAAGCVRVVMVEGSDRMPMEEHAQGSIDQDFIGSFSDRRDSLCEISRLAVDGAFRRRRRERETRFGNVEVNAFSAWERRTFPLIALALIVGAGAVADLLNRRNCFAIMEPFLPLMLQRAGMGFRRVGSDFDYRGVRAPYYADINQLIAEASPERRLFFQAVRERFAAVLLPSSAQ